MAQAIHHLQTQPHNRFDADDFRLTLLHATTSPAQADLTPEKRVRDTELKKTFPLNCLFILYFRTSGIAVARTMLQRTISLLLLLSISMSGSGASLRRVMHGGTHVIPTVRHSYNAWRACPNTETVCDTTDTDFDFSQTILLFGIWIFEN